MTTENKKQETRNKKQETSSRWRGNVRILPFVSGFLFLVSCLGLSLADDPKNGPKPEPPVTFKKKVKQPKADEPDKKADDKKADDKPEAKPDEKQPEKKKVEPPRKEKAGKGDDPEAMPDEEHDAKETVARISKNMRNSEDRLAKKDPGEGTRQIQRDILKDLDSLIEQNKRQQQQQQQQDSDSRNQQQKEKNQQKAGGKRKDRDQQSSAQKDKGKEKGKGQGQDGQGGGRSPDGSKIADLYKDIWGHLPETLRQEMDAYSREQFMAKYQELLKQYYATIAEKGRKQGD